MLRFIFSILSVFLTFMVIGQKYNHEYINYNLSCEVNNNKLTVQTQVLVQINNREGDTNSRISIPYSGNNKIAGLSGYLEDDDGKIIRKLKNSDVHVASNISDMSLYEDHFIKSFELKHNQYPYRIYYTYQETFDEFSVIADWTPAADKKVPSHQAQLTLKVPLDYEVRIPEQNVSEHSVDTIQSFIKYTWKEKYDTVIKKGVYNPEDYSKIKYYFNQIIKKFNEKTVIVKK